MHLLANLPAWPAPFSEGWAQGSKLVTKGKSGSLLGGWPRHIDGVWGASQRDIEYQQVEGGRRLCSEQLVPKNPLWSVGMGSSTRRGPSSPGWRGGVWGKGMPTCGPPYTKRTVGCFFPGCKAWGL